MISLNDREWNAFTIGSLFDVSRPVSRTKDSYGPGDVPFIASGAVGNGVVKYCEPHADEALDEAGCITVSPVDGSCFYQPVAFLGRGGGGSSIMKLRSASLTEYGGRFVARMITQTLSAKYTYGRMGNSRMVVRERIMLPVDSSGDPDWQFMEDYIRERETIQLHRLQSFLNKQITEIERERE